MNLRKLWRYSGGQAETWMLQSYGVSRRVDLTQYFKCNNKLPLKSRIINILFCWLLMSNMGCWGQKRHFQINFTKVYFTYNIKNLLELILFNLLTNLFTHSHHTIKIKNISVTLGCYRSNLHHFRFVFYVQELLTNWFTQT